MARKQSGEEQSRRQSTGKPARKAAGQDVQREVGAASGEDVGGSALPVRGRGAQEPAPRPDDVEEAGEESFPASDPPSWAPRVRLGPPRRAQP